MVGDSEYIAVSSLNVIEYCRYFVLRGTKPRGTI